MWPSLCLCVWQLLIDRHSEWHIIKCRAFIEMPALSSATNQPKNSVWKIGSHFWTMRLKSGWNRDNYGLMMIVVFGEIKWPISSWWFRVWLCCGEYLITEWHSFKHEISNYFLIFQNIKNRQPRLNVTQILVMHKSGGGAYKKVIPLWISDFTKVLRIFGKLDKFCAITIL